MARLESQKRFEARDFIAVGFVLGAVVAGTVAFAISLSQPLAVTKIVRQSDLSSTTYQFTDPLVFIRSAQADSPDYAMTRSAVESYVVEQQKSGLLAASVFMRDIGQNEGFVTDPTEQYSPESLFKVPLMMAYYQLSETNPSILSQQITYSGQQDLSKLEDIKSSIQLTAGSTYTVEQLIEHMIRYSDNNAAQLLLDNLSAQGEISAYNSLFQNLGITLDASNPDANFLTVVPYSIFFRVLYNATYLDRADSEKALQLLSQTDFSVGLEAGVPNNVTVAQKFGEGQVIDSTGKTIGDELHDCGIVYYPGHPYLLCIMTKGYNLQVLENSIASISHIIYANMEARYPNSS